MKTEDDDDEPGGEEIIDTSRVKPRDGANYDVLKDYSLLLSPRSSSFGSGSAAFESNANEELLMKSLTGDCYQRQLWQRT